MNLTFLEKVRCLLSNTRLAKSFWAEALTYANHLINRFPSSAIEGKTLMEVCQGKLLKIMVYSGYLDVQPIITSKKINGILEQRRLYFWVSREM